MPQRQNRSFIRLCVANAIAVVLAAGVHCAQAQDRELKVGYMKNPIQDASLDIMEKGQVALGSSMNAPIAEHQLQMLCDLRSPNSRPFATNIDNVTINR
jgi:hypothetical protein